MVMAGGTGGHVFPALAVAKYLRSQGENIVWMGTRSGIEARLVPQAGIPVEWLKVQGIRGKGGLALAMAPFKLMRACWQALTILRRNKPRAVLGMGGFAAGPGGLMAWLMQIPLVIHEQNAVIGLTNRILSHIACISFFAFPRAAEGVKRSMVVGNPVRDELLTILPPQQRLAQRDSAAPINILVIGGSLGARTLNRVLPEALSSIEPGKRPQVRHQCGAKHLQECKQYYLQYGVDAQVHDFIDDMKSVYEWADLVVCRAGAMTVAELTAVGVASILVPFPYAVDDHQYYNAEYLSTAAAARRVREVDFNPSWLADTLRQFIDNRKALFDMACNARALSLSDSTQRIATQLLKEAIA
jgi:UDP-N-acetylglucosamine--N-acetylmuramyl-(pentapeptide) pyrophosphoryl-undecaprenol N-acetylglucosamine transferase